MNQWAISRSADSVDVFRVNGAGTLQTARRTAAGWSDWSAIGTIAMPAYSSVTAVSPIPGRIDLFIAGDDNLVRRYQQSGPGAPWLGPIIVAGLTISHQPYGGDRQSVHAIARNGGIDLFAEIAALAKPATPFDFWVQVVHAHFSVATGQWSAWQDVAAPKFGGNCNLSAIARDPGALDIFAFDHSNILHSQRTDADPAWTPWQRIGDNGPAIIPSAVTRGPLDMAVISGQVGASIAFSDPAHNNGAWTDWKYGEMLMVGQPVRAVAIDARTIVSVGFTDQVDNDHSIVSSATLVWPETGGEPDWTPWTGAIGIAIPGSIDNCTAEICFITRSDAATKTHAHVFVQTHDSMWMSVLDAANLAAGFSEWAPVGPAPMLAKPDPSGPVPAPAFWSRVRSYVRNIPVWRWAKTVKFPGKRPGR